MGSRTLANGGIFTFQARVPLAWRYREDPDTRPQINSHSSYLPRERLYIQRDKVSYVRNGTPYFIPECTRVRREINPDCPIHGQRHYRNRLQRSRPMANGRATMIRDSISEESSESVGPCRVHHKRTGPLSPPPLSGIRHNSRGNHSHLPQHPHLQDDRLPGPLHMGLTMDSNEYLTPITQIPKIPRIIHNPGSSPNPPLPSRLPTLPDRHDDPCACYKCCHGYRKFIWLLWIIIIIGAIAGIIGGFLYTIKLEKEANSTETQSR